MSLDDLEARLDAPRPEAWMPDPGDKITGTVVEVSTAVSKPEYGGEEYPVLVVRQKDGTELSVYCSRTVLKSEVTLQAPQVGDDIAIKHLGVPAGKRYESYRVLVERKSPRVAVAQSAPAPSGPVAEQSDEDLFG